MLFPPVLISSKRALCVELDNVRFARSHAVRKRRSEQTSNVPPPRSKINTLRSRLSVFFLSNPYAIAAAVGSFIIHFQGFIIFIYQNFNCASKLKLILSIVDDDDIDDDVD
ncbi:hypothetical protein DERP_005363 [Dermatophagoides pteronyssinus]|uniref:Transmembrane protein n=1 Tax=Dermatophagoides pteronyssinus TaxID=6956 RepID=A0ABQ8JMS3_DERPT|nr:hypothetical protein DERP_005363 [Dermatophagoides pteronyssinus]